MPTEVLDILRHLSDHPVLQVTDPQFAEVLKLEPNRAYLYYKPSVANGFNEATFDPMVNVQLAQVLNGGMCRATLKLKGNAPRVDLLTKQKAH